MIVRSKVIMRMMQFNVIHTKRRRSTDVFRVARRLIECANLTLRPEEYFRYSFSWVGRCYIIPNLNNCIARTSQRDLSVLLDRIVICRRYSYILNENLFGIRFILEKLIYYHWFIRSIDNFGQRDVCLFWLSLFSFGYNRINLWHDFWWFFWWNFVLLPNHSSKRHSRFENQSILFHRIISPDSSDRFIST